MPKKRTPILKGRKLYLLWKIIMTVQQAIEKAIEGGWDKSQNEKLFPFVRDTWSDPLFWQSLGKALGWNETHTDGKKKWLEWHKWKFEWHRFLDFLAEGKSAEEFFATLD